MRIGELAKQSGVSVKAVRVYERLGLLPAPARRGRYRDYEPSVVHRVVIIRSARDLGIRLAEMKALSPHFSLTSARFWQAARALLDKKRAEFAEEQRRLDDRRAALAAMSSHVEACLQALADRT